MEVLRLIADGLPNQEIADKLFIGERTVKSHVSNILSKLHLSDRTQAAVYAWSEGIVRKE
jgi:NarL family two-component system response regulator LiaR